MDEHVIRRFPARTASNPDRVVFSDRKVSRVKPGRNKIPLYSIFIKQHESAPGPAEGGEYKPRVRDYRHVVDKEGFIVRPSRDDRKGETSIRAPRSCRSPVVPEAIAGAKEGNGLIRRHGTFRGYDLHRPLLRYGRHASEEHANRKLHGIPADERRSRP